MVIYIPPLCIQNMPVNFADRKGRAIVAGLKNHWLPEPGIGRIGIITGLFDRKSKYRIRSVACLFDESV
jgi:hypothetical protein